MAPVQTSPHTDIRLTGWVSRLPAAVRPYALLARLDRPIGTWLLFLPGVWGILLPATADSAAIQPLERLRLLVLFGVGSIVMRSAGCVVNDMWDRDIDRQVSRTAGRPLASGALRMRHAVAFLSGLLFIGLMILLQLNPLSQALGAASLILVGLYPLAKRFTWWPQLVMGFTFGFGAPLGYAAAADRMDFAQATLYAATIFWQLGFDTIYGFQDMEDDARIGVKSTSRLMAGRARGFVGACYGLAGLSLIFSGLLAHIDRGFFPAIMICIGAMLLQASRIDTSNPSLCLAQFKANRAIGLGIAAAFLAGRLL
ncbi:4-hydroxybenzoate polyprenyltransferase [Acetobacter nitrogenifigens DSM 23921 = NBRC 105050]|uniref:4-hydroxybenzoate octaprenyltransferase n=1 Tax=Acetobacter nitrogenifigens DSM 23921 = NBRC 105050 TaxID=1120919 RepID=A0A511XE69_9PROT|nr:4-hydroxybenzoate octaprenyltransferase [Acetobacter nitrogenifigens]GBQ88017.1 4-hydroxybenzoate polyprenyltransferase [Acetobacter nitrogenifigens DSM 23921 = NBRC 105050]GEN61252.1 4-hydroxybenzoate octaprenyltransferase [Acetobacter nitrogenifigens DSM 23921 = NBRC 105050]